MSEPDDHPEPTGPEDPAATESHPDRPNDPAPNDAGTDEDTTSAGSAGETVRSGWPGWRSRGRQGPADDSDAEAEGFLARMLAQWEQLRTERQEQLAAPVPLAGATRRAEVPYGVELAASWSWRLLVIAAAGALVLWLIGYLAIVVVPIVIAMLITALVSPVARLMSGAGIPRSASSLLSVFGVLGLITVMLVLATRQVAAGSSDMADQVVAALGDIRHWLRDGPLNASDSQISAWLKEIQGTIADVAQTNPIERVTVVGGVAADTVAGLFIVIFATYFFLADGRRIWSWVVRLAPRAARDRVDTSGQVAWISLTQFTRATVIVAAVDAVGIMAAALILQVPFVAAIGVLVFLSAFVPLIGATIAGTVAVLIALLDQGFVVALLMLAAVIIVQQLEAHLLQPFLMGKWVAVHPLAVILAIATGIVVAGVAGALVAVPLAAALNAVVLHLTAGQQADAAGPPGPEQNHPVGTAMDRGADADE